MKTVTLTSKYQISIPKALREEMGLKKGQKFEIIAKQGSLHLVPVRSFSELRGVMKGANTRDYREHNDRL